MALNLTRRQARRAFLVRRLRAASLALAGCQTGPRGPVGRARAEPPPVARRGRQQGRGDRAADRRRRAGRHVDRQRRQPRPARHRRASDPDHHLRQRRPGGAAAAAERAIAEGNRLILGPLLAEDVRAAAPVARRAGVPVIAFSNDEGVAGNGVYIMGFTPDQSIGRVVGYARAQGRRAASPRWSRPGSMASGRRRRCSARCASPAGGSPRSRPTTARRRRSPPRRGGSNAKGAFDAVLIADSGRMAALGRAADQGRPAPARHRTVGDRPDDRHRLPRCAAPGIAAAPDAQFNQLVTRYRARYGKTPTGSPASAMTRCCWPCGARATGRSAGRSRRKSLIDKDGFAGVDGNFRFGRDGVAERLLEVRQVTPAGTTIVSPAATAF